MATVEIRDAAPIRRLSLPIPEGGGIVVLRGRNGSGKTKTLEAIDKLISGKGTVSVRDGALKARVTGFGATLTVARSATRSGTLEVESLDGNLSIADLVQPPIKDPGAADARRIKTLVSLAGAGPDVSRFHGLIGGKERFEELIPLAEADDLVALAAQVKREFEGAARKSEDAAKRAHIRAEALRESIAGLSLVEPAIDSTAAYRELQETTETQTALAERLKAANKATEAQQEARRKLLDVEQEYKGPSVEEAQQAAAETLKHAQRKLDDFKRLRAELKAAEKSSESANTTHGHAHRELEQAQQHHQAMAAWRSTLDAEVPEPPDPESIATATERLTDARLVVASIPAYEQAKRQQAEAVEADRDAGLANAAADTLRDAAKGTDTILSEVVGTLGTPLRVEGGRLVLDTDRGATHFHELSHGERWRQGLDVAVSVAGDRTVFTIPQDAWESLDPINRAAVAEHVRAKGITVLTAEASADEQVTPEVFGEETAEERRYREECGNRLVSSPGAPDTDDGLAEAITAEAPGVPDTGEGETGADDI